jgi:hypothetical protein
MEKMAGKSQSTLQDRIPAGGKDTASTKQHLKQQQQYEDKREEVNLIFLQNGM